jgi:hypothetical protein
MMLANRCSGRGGRAAELEKKRGKEKGSKAILLVSVAI